MKSGSMIETAYAILKENGSKENGTMMKFSDLWGQVKERLEILPEEEPERIGRFYSDLSLDGKFSVFPDNYWDLSERYKFSEVHADASKFYEADDPAAQDPEDAKEEREYNQYMGSDTGEEPIPLDDEGELVDSDGEPYEGSHRESDYE